MRIDWAQTLFGPSTSAAETETRSPHDAVGRWFVAFRAGRLLGLGLAAIGLALTLASLPFRSIEAFRADVLPFSALLITATISLALASGQGGSLLKSARFAPLAGALMIPLVPIAGLPSSTALAMAASVIVDAMLAQVAFERSARRRSLLLAGFAFALAMLVSGISILDSSKAVFFGILASVSPVATGILWLLQGHRSERKTSHIDPPDADMITATYFDAMMRSDRGLSLVVRVNGTLVPPPRGPLFRHFIAHQPLLEQGLMEAVMVVDRPLILQALSQAVHQQAVSDHLNIRLRRDPAGAGFAYPPRFEHYRCTITPCPQLPGHAVIRLEDAVAEQPAQTHPISTPVGAQTLSRVMHDIVSPFNAGLGFLEMMTSERLAPRDIGTFQRYATEAHRAVSDAHWNTRMLGDWLRLSHADDPAVPLNLRNELEQACRQMGLLDPESRVSLRFDIDAALPPLTAPAHVLQLLVKALLRVSVAQAEPGANLRLSAEQYGDSIALVLRNLDDPIVRAGKKDAFLEALERSCLPLLAFEFSSGLRGGEHRLTLKTGAPDARPVNHGAEAPVAVLNDGLRKIA